MIFAALALWELIVLGVFGVGFLLLLANEVEGYATLMFAIVVGLLVWFCWDPVKEFFSQPGAALLAVKWTLLYLVAGLAFAILKWVLYSRKRGKQCAKDRVEWFAAHNSRVAKLLDEIDRYKAAEADLPGALARGDVSRHTTERDVRNSLEYAQRNLDAENASFFLKEYKLYGIIRVQGKENGTHETSVNLISLGGYVTAWASYWPAYAVLLVLDDFLRAFWDIATRALQQVFIKITKWSFGG